MAAWILLPLIANAMGDGRQVSIDTGYWDRLAVEFRDPPVESRPMLRWWWFGGAVTDDELASQLEEMRRQGFGGVEIQPVYPLALDDASQGIRNLPYLSEEFCSRLRFAVEKARELGMTVDLTLGSGWPFGGPHIRPAERARKISLHETTVGGPGLFERVANPDPKDTDRVVAVLALRADAPPGAAQDVRDISSNLSSDGTIRWEAPPGDWKVAVAVESDTGQQVKRPTVGAEGYVHDHYSLPALERHIDLVGERLLAAVGGGQNIGCFFCDSWEVFGANWTSDFLDVFKRRRKYDLKQLFPLLWDETSPQAGAIRYDFRKTLSELALERFFEPLADYCESRGVCARIQAHGTPADTLLGYAAAHIPEGESIGAEGDRWAPEIAKRRTASSAAHLFGKPICSAEAYTWLRHPRYCTTLEQMKAASDVFFLDGINQIVGHGFPYSPRTMGSPGRNFYAATMINPNNTWWPCVNHLTGYVSRVSHMLRQGTWVADVLVYLPSGDTWSKPFEGHLSSSREWGEHIGAELLWAILASGFNFDVANDEVILQHAQVKDQRLVVREQSYRIVILPAVRRIPPATLHRISELADSGGVVIAWKNLPEESCSYPDRANQSQVVRELTARMFSPGGPRSAFHVADAAQLGGLLRKFEPDVVFDPPNPSLGFVHRRLDDSDVYFLANVSPEPVEVSAAFRSRGVPVLWDPTTGERLLAGYWSDTGSGTRIRLDLEAFKSTLVVFRPPSQVPLGFHLRTNLASPGIREGCSGWIVEGDASRRGKYWAGLGDESATAEVEAPPDDIVMRGPWELSFSDWAEPRMLEALRSWTELPELRFYSGAGTYLATFDIPSACDIASVRAELELGEVHEIAEVWVNDARTGTVWHRPHRLDITEVIRPGENQLRVVVTNLLINRVLGTPDPDYSELEKVYGRRFPPPREKSEVDEPLPSGLLGPVRISFKTRVRLQLLNSHVE